MPMICPCKIYGAKHFLCCCVLISTIQHTKRHYLMLTNKRNCDTRIRIKCIYRFPVASNWPKNGFCRFYIWLPEFHRQNHKTTSTVSELNAVSTMWCGVDACGTAMNPTVRPSALPLLAHTRTHTHTHRSAPPVLNWWKRARNRRRRPGDIIMLAKSYFIV